MNNTPFTTRAVVPDDFEKGVRYQGAGSGVIAPGDIAKEVLGEDISFGRLFAYCFRRFGHPNAGSDPYKELASYYLTTPMKGLFLSVAIKALTHTHLQFGYVMQDPLERELGQEHRATTQEFHARFLAWRQQYGHGLPRDNVAPGTFLRGAEREDDMRLFGELLTQYCAEGGVHYDDMPVGPKTQEVLDALRATLEDLKTPVNVRDCLFSAINDSVDDVASDEDDDGDQDLPIAEPHHSAGYPIPTDYLADPQLFMALSRKLGKLGDGSLARGIALFVGNEGSSA